ncbi:uncharacterized protein LOC135698599 [Ochlerotatus camptorhynchus]|uniref:uncharacterized protein LOC135698599 n=1 Tax=Ochlerotatus camptorhynchus TaxID=644619 RepID=UPI0031D1E6FB
MAPGLRTLCHQERFYLDTLANAKQFVSGYDAEQHRGQLAGWKQRIDGLDEKFHANRLAIELSFDDEDEDEQEEDEVKVAEKEAEKAAAQESNRLIRQKFELDYVLVYSFLANEIKRHASCSQPNLNQHPPIQSRVNLPNVKLPSFDGTISEWITFRDSFKSLIDSNADLSHFDKFSYLMTSLTKDARKVIEAIELTAANYPVAWQLLENRFENKKLIFKTYMDALFSIEPMKRESYESLTRLVDEFERNLKMIDKMGFLTENWSPGNPPNQSFSQTHSPSSSSSSGSQQPSATSLVSTNVVGVPSVPATVLLQTAIIKVFASNGQPQWARALLDPASQLNLITENIVQRLKLRRYHCHQEIGGVGNSVIVSSYAVHVQMASHCTDFKAVQSFHILKNITQDLPTRTLDTSTLQLPPNVVLADPKFFVPSSIDILLGMELYYDLLLDGFAKLGPEKPILQNTVFGWVASDKIGSGQCDSTPKVAHVCSDQSLDSLITRFWEVESCWSASTQSAEEVACEEHFVANTYRDDSGRFVVTLPKHTSILSQLGDSKQIATRRFLALERRLDANPPLKQAYTNFIDEYLQLGHMREVNDSTCSPAVPSYYLPHHGVEKADSTTTKLRVVFDGSCRTDSGVSLNQALMVGSVVQDDLLAIHLRFRMNRIALIADIEKMYRQLLIHLLDYPLQRILWRRSLSELIRTYELMTVTYGTASAPFLATRCLKELSKQGAEDFPLASLTLAKDFYVDDMLTGVYDEEEGEELCKQLLALLKSAGFSLRKWASNSTEVLSKIPIELRDERSVLALDSPSTSIKTLGIQWQPSSDTYSYAVPEWSTRIVITRRVVASDLAKLFLPLGLLGPVVVLAKIFVQSLWQTTTSWDEPLTPKQQQYWREWRDSLIDLPLISIPRWAAFARDPVLVELHGFCDASERAYGACVYLRTVSIDGSISVRLLCAKSRVAPSGKSKNSVLLTLPLLELSSALLLAHLYDKVSLSISLKTKPFFWTDSMIVLCQIRSPPARWKKFIANRVSEIQRLTAGGIWSHVPGSENPADIISRGMNLADLRNTPAWWIGAQWLNQPSRFWPPINQPIPDNLPNIAQAERPISLPVQAVPPNELFELRSSFPRLVRLVTYLRRFQHNVSYQNRNNRKTGHLTTFELNDTTQFLVRIAQQESFARELSEISTSGHVSSRSELKNLSPILINGILRVGGRLRHAAISEDRKHPMILPARHTLTERILVHYHEKHLHAGPQLLVACVREKFWPLRIRNLARKVVHSCVNCYRCKPNNLEQLMGDLPPERVTPTLPFLNTGVDLCGPFQYRNSPRASAVKCYVAIFVCLVTKATHVELVYDLSTAAFLAALHRFTARRGTPKLIECDNAKNFKGAAKELAKLRRQFYDQQHQAAVINHCADDGIAFKFIPPRSPNFGGLWEAAVKSFKKHLRATIGNSVLSQDEFITLLARIEACLNSRPLTPLSADPNDLEVLTPGHFLIHRPLTSFPEPDLSEIPKNRLDRWQENNELLRRIWKRWSTDYLSGLHPRTKWTQQRDNIDVGTLVLLKENNLPPLKWKYGRITRVYRGEDNNIRVAVVRTADGEYTRSISKICVLPIRQPTTDVASPANPNSEQ